MNKKTALVIIVCVLAYVSVFWVNALSHANVTIIYKIEMDDNTLEAFKICSQLYKCNTSMINKSQTEYPKLNISERIIRYIDY